MRLILFVLLLTFFVSSLKAESLTCSTAGTQILHIPGAFTSEIDQKKADERIKDLLELKAKYYDLKKQSSKLIPIASQGLIMDKLNYIMLSLQPGTARDVAWLLLGSIEFGISLKNYLIAVLKSGGTASAVQKGGAVVTKFRGTVKNKKFVIQSVTKKEVTAMFNITSTSMSVSKENLNSIKEILETIAGQDKHRYSIQPGRFF